jgi:HK97 family phage prohead protease
LNAPVTIDMPVQRRQASVRASSFQEENNSIEVVWTTGAKVRRYSWRDDVYYDEELVVTAAAIRLERMNAGAPFLDTHDDLSLSSVIGSVVPGTAEIRGGKGYCRVQLSVAPEHAGVVANIKAGIIRNISVGYRSHKIEKSEEDGEIPVWRVVDWEPLEISAVAVPADAGAQVRSEPTGKLYPTKIIKKERRMAAKSNSNPVLDDEELEETRAMTIAKLGRQFGVADFAAEHIEQRTTVADFRSALINRMADEQSYEIRSNHASPAQARGIGDFDQRRAQAMESAILHRVDPQGHPLAPGAETFVALPLLEIARAAVEARGVRTAGMSKMILAGEALGQRGGGMLTTSDFPAVLANVTNRTLRAAYEAAPQTFRPFVRVATVSDFKENSRAQISEAPQLLKVNEHGEYKRGAMGDAAEKFKLETFGRIISITRQAIVNDDLSAFDRIPRAFGVQAAQLESDLVWGQIMSNPAMGDGKTLFHADHKNLLTAGAIGETTVGEARKTMGLQTGVDGATALNLTPEYLLVPKALEVAALKFVTTITPAKTADAVPQEIRNLVVIAEPRLDLGIARYGIAGAPGAYYFASRPTFVDVIELAYLEGQQGVYTETRMGFDVDGMEIKARLDVAAKAIDWRGLAKNSGA